MRLKYRNNPVFGIPGTGRGKGRLYFFRVMSIVIIERYAVKRSNFFKTPLRAFIVG
jgi:hypothetical protein